MKKLTLLLCVLPLLLISCDTGKSKKMLNSDGTSVTPITNKIATEVDKNIQDTLLFTDEQKILNTPWMDNPQGYFRTNNKYRDWNKKDKKAVVVVYSTLKDGTNINVIVKKSSGNQTIDDEAIRLVKNMKYQKPAIDFNNNPVNIKNMAIVVHFPSM